jgi:predicted metal-dependent phosphoesterase TrpH
MKVDLHVHTIASSDGDYTSREVVEIACQKKLQAIALTDHDSVEGLAEGLYWGGKLGLEVIPGCEFYAQHQGKWLHILGYFIDYKSPHIRAFSRKIEAERKKTVQKQIDILRQANFCLEVEKVYEESARPMFHTYAKVVFAETKNKDNPILKKYHDTDNPLVRFCMDWLVPGKPLNAPQYTPEAREIIRLIKELGGVPVLAHPGATLVEKEDYIIDDLIKHGLIGLEIYTSWHQRKNEQHYERYAKGKNLIITCGSDFHGSLKPYAKLGEIKNNTYAVVEKLKATKTAVDWHGNCNI